MPWIIPTANSSITLEIATYTVIYKKKTKLVYLFYDIFPQEIYLQDQTISGEIVLAKLSRLEVFFRNCMIKNQLNVNAEDKILAVLKDHSSEKIEYLLPKNLIYSL